MSEQPQVVLTWNPQKLGVELTFRGFQGPVELDFVLMLLEGAKVQLAFQRNLIAAQQMNAQQAEIQQAQRLANDLRRNGIR